MKKNYFIPIVIVINNTQVPSTPFNLNDGKPLFLGDVFTVEYPDGFKETLVVDLIEGQYVATGSHLEVASPLWIFDELPINVLGSSVEKPELLNLLSK